MINVILDMRDIKTSLFMLTLAFTQKIKSITIDHIDIPKEHLKLLLKVQTLCLLEVARGGGNESEEVQSEYSIIS